MVQRLTCKSRTLLSKSCSRPNCMSSSYVVSCSCACVSACCKLIRATCIDLLIKRQRRQHNVSPTPPPPLLPTRCDVRVAASHSSVIQLSNLFVELNCDRLQDNTPRTDVDGLRCIVFHSNNSRTQKLALMTVFTPLFLELLYP